MSLQLPWEENPRMVLEFAEVTSHSGAQLFTPGQRRKVLLDVSCSQRSFSPLAGPASSPSARPPDIENSYRMARVLDASQQSKEHLLPTSLVVIRQSACSPSIETTISNGRFFLWEAFPRFTSERTTFAPHWQSRIASSNFSRLSRKAKTRVFRPDLRCLTAVQKGVTRPPGRCDP
jgi:hypothetical protein